MGAGMFFCGLAFVLSGVVQIEIEKSRNIAAPAFANQSQVRLLNSINATVNFTTSGSGLDSVVTVDGLSASPFESVHGESLFLNVLPLDGTEGNKSATVQLLVRGPSRITTACLQCCSRVLRHD